jgi:hypothetical protein
MSKKSQKIAKNHRNSQKFTKIYKNSQKYTTFEQVRLGLLAHLIENRSQERKIKNKNAKCKIVESLW